ncbi:MAG: PIF1 family DEAD/DEAH box helicase [Candidatus Komeilibacteria bacterium]
MTQAQALAILKTGANVFLTGEPGAGKTHTINQYVDYLRQHNIEPAITASTGIAATHIGGMTIHSWSGIGIKKFLSSRDLDALAANEYLVKRVAKTKVLIIDEVSMLAPETITMVEAVCREIKRNNEPFGGLQIIFVGDFFQLPPVVRPDTDEASQGEFFEEEPELFAYQSPAWSKANPLVCYLHEQHRQDDPNFLQLLTAIRSNTFTDAHLKDIQSRKISSAKAPQDVTKLFSHNANVDAVNQAMLDQLPGKNYSYEMKTQGKSRLVQSLQKGCLSPDNLQLKTGAAVMFTKNNSKQGFVNGTLGVVAGFDDLTRQPIIKTRQGQRIAVEPMDWTLEEGGKIRARLTQFPLRLAWAITVHKSQGMSLDEAIMDLSQVFEFGQGYVALSRVRRLAGLHLLGWNEQTFQVHPQVLAQDAMFREGSAAAESIFGQMSAGELKQLQNNFILACGGKAQAKVKKTAAKVKKETSGYYDEVRKLHPNANRRWDSEQDARLAKLFSAGSTIPQLMTLMGRREMAIILRLIKLELLPADYVDQRSLNSDRS